VCETTVAPVSDEVSAAIQDQEWNGDPIAVGGDVLRRLINVSCDDVSVTIDVEALTVGVRYSLPAVRDTGYRMTILT
jgi:hypothetical protein